MLYVIWQGARPECFRRTPCEAKNGRVVKYPVCDMDGALALLLDL